MTKLSSTILIILIMSSFLVAQVEDTPSPEANSETTGSAKHVFMSLILPGSGEYMMGKTGLGKFFMGTELTLWAGLFASNKYVDVLDRNLKAYAATHANVNSANKDEQYWIDVGTASTIYEFNEMRLLERRLDLTYPEDSHYDWVWDNEDHRDEYVRQRFNRLDWKRSSTFVVSGLVLNRIVSAIDVIRLIRGSKTTDQFSSRQSYMHFDYSRDDFGEETLRLNFTWLLGQK